MLDVWLRTLCWSLHVLRHYLNHPCRVRVHDDVGL